MRIAIDSGPLTSGDSVRGIGVYARELLKALHISGVDVSAADLRKYEIVHFTRFNPFFLSVPFFKPKNTKFVLTIYDLIPLVYPDHYPPGIRGYFKFQINKYLINKNIDAIITISETSKKDICRFLGIDPGKVFVTHLAPRTVFRHLETKGWKNILTKKYGLPDKFALYVGELNYNKNIPNLIKGCKIAKIPLVIAGRHLTNGELSIIDHPELVHLKEVDWSGVKCLGFVEDDDLVKIFNLATVYVQASYYEGFGLPVVEAVSSQTPVVVAKTQCLVEVLGNEFCYVDPSKPQSITEGIINPNIGKKLPRKYSWTLTAEKTMSVYKKVLGVDE